MKPTIGGPHWKVSTGGSVVRLAPASAATMPTRLSALPGAIQPSRVSQRILGVMPSNLTSETTIWALRTWLAVEALLLPLVAVGVERLLYVLCRDISIFLGLK